MKATYGFRATVTARPGKGDELVALLLSAISGEGPATNEDCVCFLVGRSVSNPDVVSIWEGWTTKEAHAKNFASERAKAFTAKIAALAALLAGDGRYEEEVQIGGKWATGATP